MNQTEAMLMTSVPSGQPLNRRHGRLIFNHTPSAVDFNAPHRLFSWSSPLFENSGLADAYFYVPANREMVIRSLTLTYERACGRHNRYNLTALRFLFNLYVTDNIQAGQVVANSTGEWWYLNNLIPAPAIRDLYDVINISRHCEIITANEPTSSIRNHQERGASSPTWYGPLIVEPEKYVLFGLLITTYQPAATVLMGYFYLTIDGFIRVKNDDN